MKTVLSRGLEYLDGKKFDLVISNPPYIPRESTVENNPYEGIGLLSGLIQQSPNYLTKKGFLILNISSLCENKSIALMKDMNLKYEKIDDMIVPLKVLSVLNNDIWMNFLHENSLNKNARDGYDYWQTINIYKIEGKN
jgi:hypothetical protein